MHPLLLAVSVACSALSAPWATAAPVPKPPPGIDKATAAAWAKRGFSAGWISESRNFAELSAEYPPQGGVPALWYSRANARLTDADLVGLPPVGVPFALKMSGITDVTDAGLEHLVGLKNLARLDLSGTSVSGPGLKHLASFPQLTTLKLSGNLADEDVKHLVELKELRAIYFGGARLTDAALKHLSALPHLSVLDLHRASVTDAGLKHLKPLKQLTRLYLEFTLVSDAGVADLAQFERLTLLSLSESRVTGAKLEPLTGLKRLTYLGLSGEQVTDDTLRVLAAAGRLHVLSQIEAAEGSAEDSRPAGPHEVTQVRLHYTGATDAGLRYLAALPNLTSLIINGKQATAAGLKHVAALPALNHLGIDIKHDAAPAGLKELVAARKLTEISVRVTDDTLRAAHAAGLLHRLRAARGAGGINGPRPAVPDDVAAFDLWDADIGVEGVKILGTLKNLELLTLSGSRLPTEAEAEFRRRKPKCEVKP